MPRTCQNHQPSLFDAPTPRVTLSLAQRDELANLVEVLLREIARALGKQKSRESGDEQDHR
jgi:hypothetical protein